MKPIVLPNTVEYAAVDPDAAAEIQNDQWYTESQRLRNERQARQGLDQPTYDPQGTVAVFLDIDGVVSPLPGPDYYEGLPLCTFVQPMVPVTVEVLEWLNTPTLSRRVWSSSWGSMSLDLTHDLGAGPVETAVTDTLRNKPLAVNEYLKAHPEITAAVVCDDDPYTVPTGLPVHYIHPDPYRGLTAEHLREIDEHISHHMR